MIFLCDLGYVSGWIGLCFLHFVLSNCYALQCMRLRGKGKKKRESKTGNDWSAPNWETVWLPVNLFSFFFFFPSEFSVVFALDILLILKIIIGKQLWSFWLHSTFFSAHWHYKHLLTSDLGINFLGYNIFAILHLNLPNIIKPFKWH